MASTHARHMADIILGGQDGLVNVLGLTMGVASAGAQAPLVIVAGLAGMLSESISMGAVAYTSTKATQDYEAMRGHEAGMSRAEVEKTLRMLSPKLPAEKRAFVRARLQSHLFEDGEEAPRAKAVSVGLATLAGSAVPLVPYLLLPLGTAMAVSIALSALVLFGTGALKAHWTIGSWQRSGLEILLVGGLAAAAGYALGLLLHVPL
ncbi:MAG: VIT1/CCC1 transporter family protein [Candidatus Micrarchaeota archaeon]|nr:VIT1/CCC1 transporter family protein [Candidatus Micrarchaeota archaeon]